MKTKYAALVAIVLLIPGSNLQAEEVLFEDFEDATVTYTVSNPDDLSSIVFLDYFGRIASDTSTPGTNVSYSNLQGTGYYGAQDMDTTPSGNIDVITLEWVGIDISSFTNLNLSWFVAEDDAADAAEDWDANSSLRLESQINGGGYQNLFAIESEAGTNSVPRVDTDFDGFGDGAAITDFFTQYSSILGDGLTLDLRMTVEFLDQGDEDIAFDNLLLSGDLIGVPEPSTTGLLALALGLVALRGQRRH